MGTPSTVTSTPVRLSPGTFAEKVRRADSEIGLPGQVASPCAKGGLEAPLLEGSNEIDTKRLRKFWRWVFIIILIGVLLMGAATWHSEVVARAAAEAKERVPSARPFATCP